MSTNPFAKKPDASKTGKNIPGKPGDKPDGFIPFGKKTRFATGGVVLGGAPPDIEGRADKNPVGARRGYGKARGA